MWKCAQICEVVMRECEATLWRRGRWKILDGGSRSLLHASRPLVKLHHARVMQFKSKYAAAPSCASSPSGPYRCQLCVRLA